MADGSTNRHAFAEAATRRITAASPGTKLGRDYDTMMIRDNDTEVGRTATSLEMFVAQMELVVESTTELLLGQLNHLEGAPPSDLRDALPTAGPPPLLTRARLLVERAAEMEKLALDLARHI